jgi:hypothetical protein
LGIEIPVVIPTGSRLDVRDPVIEVRAPQRAASAPTLILVDEGVPAVPWRSPQVFRAS